MRMRVTATPAARAVLACALVGILIAGCGSSGGSAGETVTSSAVPAGPSSPATAGSQGVPAGSASAETGSSQAMSSQSAITVVTPPGSAASDTGPTSAPTTSPRAVVTTTVTVTPSATRSTRTATTARTSTPPATHSSATQPTTGHAPGTGALAGKVVVIDPGHNGANAAHPEIIRQQVPAGFGQYKDCNTTGTQTNAGYPEYRFNWNVALALRDALQAKGITVVMTRSSDDGVGPCVNKRAAIGNDAHADAVISIHGDGEAAGVRGFYVMTASRAPAGAAMAAQSADLAVAVRNGLSGAGFPESNTLGSDGLWQRSDLAGLNLSLRPTVMIECGNMRNATEAALMSSTDGQHRYARGIADGVIAYLEG